MRNNPISKNGTIRAKDARIFWDSNSGKVAVLTIGQSIPPEIDQFRYSGGACYLKWQENCSDPHKAQILCLKEFWNLVYIYEMDPVVVDNALSEIIEYQEAFEVESGGEGF
jgi:hypothetical protein